ncbi:sterol desaturase family protein [Hyphobacterium sp. CCMP332]|nr:sterol desaturase family protein [Hyphobacterium sp. CCMP332]
MATNTQKTKNINRVKVFDNPVLELLTKTHIAFPLTIFPVLSAWMIYMAYTRFFLSSVEIWAIFFFSFLLFTLVEYIVHRNVFHWVPNTPLKQFIQYHFHGVHHAEPKDKKRLAMPIVVSLALAFFTLGVAYLFIGKYSFVFTPGFAMGYTAYLGVHYMVHAYAPPKEGPFKVLWVNHAIHHYKDDSVAFGVSSPLWDVVFGTLPQKSKKAA